MNREQTPPQRTQAEIWTEWETTARSNLVKELRKRGISYKELSRRLNGLGIQESEDRLNRKVNRKKFSAAFYLACLEAIQVDE